MRVVERGNPAPFEERRGPVGVLLLHGFPGSPAEMRLLGGYLAERGVSVLGPLLPGFGTVPEDLGGISWREWAAAAAAGLEHLRGYCTQVFLCGLSMGGALALYLAGREAVAGVAALSPAVRLRDRRFEYVHLLGWLRRWSGQDRRPDDLADPHNRALTWHYRRYPTSAVVQVRGLIRAARQALPKIHLPILIVQSRRDSLLCPEGAQWAYDQIPSTDKTLLWLERSGHNIAVDVEREEVFSRVYAFVVRAVGGKYAGEFRIPGQVGSVLP